MMSPYPFCTFKFGQLPGAVYLYTRAEHLDLIGVHGYLIIKMCLTTGRLLYTHMYSR